jgi:rhodanese-related sulfurtransferase
MPRRHRPSLPLAGLLLLLLSACSDPRYQNISNQQLQELLQQGVTLIDIRTPREWAETGTVPGSHRLTFFREDGSIDPAFFPAFDALVKAPDQAVALICRTGNRTKALADYLTEKVGYQQVYNVADGITAWIRDQHPVARL